MTETLKMVAQENLLSAIQIAFERIADVPEPRREELRVAMDKQMRRVEKLFGYVPGSWQRGC
jgi:hypothetical protein